MEALLTTLHVLGAAFLHQHSPLETLCLPEPVDIDVLTRVEVGQYGISHAEIGARVLSAWKFPEQMCTLIARHHERPLPDASPLERTLHLARGLADRILSGEARGIGEDRVLAWVSEGRLAAQDIPPLLERIQGRAEGLLAGLRPGHVIARR